ncbi:MAG: arginine repressor [Lachnospiraceae bacterium]|jgi:transcriptional regulator of arginine metabolism|nr:arginine repressor [Lachnospiraceae bacterium]
MKRIRQAKIMELIREHQIETQIELADYLKKAGFLITQATVSRDIRELQLAKTSAINGRNCYVCPLPDVSGPSDKYIGVLKGGFVSAEIAGNLLVIKTVAGMAMAVAAVIDALRLPEIAGCIAGDDTIMVAIRNADAVESVRNRIYALISN